MLDKSLYDDAGTATPEPRFVDLSSLGALRTTFCAPDRGVLIFEHGSVAIAPETWFRLRTLFSLTEDSVRP